MNSMRSSSTHSAFRTSETTHAAQITQYAQNSNARDAPLDTHAMARPKRRHRRRNRSNPWSDTRARRTHTPNNSATLQTGGYCRTNTDATSTQRYRSRRRARTAALAGSAGGFRASDPRWTRRPTQLRHHRGIGADMHSTSARLSVEKANTRVLESPRWSGLLATKLWISAHCDSLWRCHTIDAVGTEIGRNGALDTAE